MSILSEDFEMVCHAIREAFENGKLTKADVVAFLDNNSGPNPDHAQLIDGLRKLVE